MKVLQFPLAKITLCYLAGIAFSYGFKPQSFLLLVASGSVLILFLAVFLRSKKTLRPNFYFGIVAHSLAFCFGALWLNLQNPETQNNCFIQSVHPKTTQKIQAIVCERLKNTVSKSRYVANVIALDGKSVRGKLLIQLAKTSREKAISVGVAISFEAQLQLLSAPKNPGQFDYALYLKNHSILAQAYPKSIRIGKIPYKDIFYYADQIRTTILHNLEKSGMPEKELAVVAALVLGQQQDITADIVQDYQFAGAVHILSVSGLHVGLILMFLHFLLQFLPHTKNFRRLGLFVTLACLWGFAVLSGLSPSVLRSVTMFSFVAVGMHLKRNTNLFHTLWVSMLLILLAEPQFLFDVGFQLSYAAVFSIIWINPIFQRFWQPENKIIRYFWQILTVSFAAQIGTLPVSLYYFHQFPGLFFVTNLIIIPFLTVIMALGVLASVWAAFGIVGWFLIAPLEYCVRILDDVIGWIASIEMFLFRNIAFNMPMLLGSYLFIATLFWWIESPDFKKGKRVLVGLATMQFLFFYSLHCPKFEPEWIVFSSYKTTLITEKKESEITAYTNVQTNPNGLLQPYANAQFATVKAIRPIPDLFYFKGKKILVIDHSAAYPKSCAPDVLLLRESPKLNLERLLQTLHPKVIVADGSNFKTYVLLWKQTCAKRNIAFHNTNELGYFKL